MRLRARSFMAFVLTPALPVGHWLAQLDKWSSNSPDFFRGRPIILDLAGSTLQASEITQLITHLAARGIRVMAIEGAEANQLDPLLPPLVQGGHTSAAGEAIAADGAVIAGRRSEPSSLLIESPIRSGQTIAFPNGDVTVLGSVSSGAEIVAGGSIHVYGALRGRAMAGVNGNSTARIYCQRIEAELLAIDGYYQTAEELDAALRNRPAQAWLEGDIMRITPLN